VSAWTVDSVSEWTVGSVSDWTVDSDSELTVDLDSVSDWVACKALTAGQQPGSADPSIDGWV
jgi:hypothetical protein